MRNLLKIKFCDSSHHRILFLQLATSLVNIICLSRFYTWILHVLFSKNPTRPRRHQIFRWKQHPLCKQNCVYYFLFVGKWNIKLVFIFIKRRLAWRDVLESLPDRNGPAYRRLGITVLESSVYGYKYTWRLELRPWTVHQGGSQKVFDGGRIVLQYFIRLYECCSIWFLIMN